MRPIVLTSMLCLAFLAQTVFGNNIRIYDEKDPSDQTKIAAPKLLSKTDDANIPANYYAIEFNMIWDNSWKTSNPRNWDAAWVFVKYNMGGNGWEHVWLADTGTGYPKPGVDKAGGGFCKGGSAGQKGAAFVNLDYSIAPGYSYIPEAGKSIPVGYFVYRSKTGYGTIQFEKFRLFWKYGDQGLSSDDPVIVSVFALEMVYVPDGEFRLGTGGDETYAFRVSYYTPNGDNGQPFIMRREDSLSLMQYANNNVAIRGADSTQLSRKGLNTTAAAINAPGHLATRIPIPKEFPKGVSGFYMMKYEITQEGYVAFLNTLNIKQQGIHGKGSDLVVGDIKTQLGRYDRATYRNGIYLFDLKGSATFVCNLTGAGNSQEDVNQVDDGQNIAMNFMNKNNLLAYLAWSGLRPFTEFEFEKASRGSQMPVKNEYVWGSTAYSPALAADNSTGVTRPGFDNEKPKPSVAGVRPNCSGTGTGMLRVGSFADSATTRGEAGASYWGIMNLSDNMMEPCVSAESKPATTLFTGTHGYGYIDELTGDAPFTTLSWPAVTHGANTWDYAWRGGHTGQVITWGRASDRSWSINTVNVRANPITGNWGAGGGRGVRTAGVSK